MKIDNNNKVYVCGDYHEQDRKLLDMLADLVAGSAIVFLGDYPVKSKSQFEDLNSLLIKYRVHAYLLRGNHDNPVYLHAERNDVNLKNSNLTILAEVDSLQWRDLNILCISGAVSVDRAGMRAALGTCWPGDEAVPVDVVEQTKKLVAKHGRFDIMLSHSSTAEGVPESCENSKLVDSYLLDDPELKDDLNLENKLGTD